MPELVLAHGSCLSKSSRVHPAKSRVVGRGSCPAISTKHHASEVSREESTPESGTRQDRTRQRNAHQEWHNVRGAGLGLAGRVVDVGIVGLLIVERQQSVLGRQPVLRGKPIFGVVLERREWFVREQRIVDLIIQRREPLFGEQPIFGVVIKRGERVVRQQRIVGEQYVFVKPILRIVIEFLQFIEFFTGAGPSSAPDV